MPARRVIVRDVWRYDSNVGRIPIPVLEVRQMAGRAGRPHYDKEGEALLIARSEREREWLVDRYLMGEVEPIRSKLGAEPALRAHLLSSIATGFVRDREGIHEFLGQTFFAYHGDEWMLSDRVDAQLSFLAQGGLIEVQGETLRATPFGKRVSQLYIDPLSALKLREALQAADQRSVSPFSFLHAISTTPDIPLLYLRAGDEWVEGELSHRQGELLFPIPEEGYEWFLASVKTALLFDAWIGEVPEEKIEAQFKIYPGDLRRYVDAARWLVYALRELGRLFHLGPIRELTHLIARVRYGVKEELIPLVMTRGVGRIRGRALFNAGYRTRGDLRKGSVATIASIPGIGLGLATKIKEQVCS
jgi:helicase